MNLFITVLALAAVFAATEAGPQGRITFGDLAYQGQFAYQVGLSRGREDSAKVWCGGSIISKNWILTAAHCVYGVPELTVRIGNTTFTSPKIKFTIPASEMIYHHEYNPSNLYNDIALIRTPDIAFDDKIYAVGLPTMKGMPDLDGEWAIASGWGANEFGAIDPSNLKWTYLQIISNKKCESSFEKNYIFEGKLCTSTPAGKSICGGDSGGPLVLSRNNVLVGVTSFASLGGCTHGVPSGFVRVFKYLDWIRSIAGVSY